MNLRVNLYPLDHEALRLFILGQIDEKLTPDRTSKCVRG